MVVTDFWPDFWFNFWLNFWPYIVAISSVTMSLAASAHIVLTKQNLRGAIGWIGVVWLTPFIGGLLYLAFGINRIQRRAVRLRSRPAHPRAPQRLLPGALAQVSAAGGLSRLVGVVSGLALQSGNQVDPLENGDSAYPAMLAAIDGAERTIALASYIFDNDAVGQVFVAALKRAIKRGVEVRVLIDGVGSRYSFPSIIASLTAAGIPVAEFLHSFMPWRIAYLNLRNHRKILVIDGRVGFTGGMNIRAGNVLAWHSDDAIQDLHFRVEGPVVEQFMAIFAEDWAFSTGEVLDWFPEIAEKKGIAEGKGMAARGVPSGPDEDFDKLKWVLLGALAEAKQSVRIVTPYFLPDEVMIAAINLKAISGVEIDIVIPARGNLRMVQWASRGQIDQLILHGCRVWQSPAPFDHSKIFLVDDHWAFIGSANWDPRSLYLNFEFNMECYDSNLVRKLDYIVAGKIARSTALTMADLAARPFFVKLRDGVARLFAPYL